MFYCKPFTIFNLNGSYFAIYLELKNNINSVKFCLINPRDIVLPTPNVNFVQTTAEDFPGTCHRN